MAEGEDSRPAMPFPDDEDAVEQPEPEAEPEPVAVAAAQNSLLDFTRNIQRKKDKEMAALQFGGGDSSSPAKPTPVTNSEKVGRNDLCPCGSGKKYKKCHGANS